MERSYLAMQTRRLELHVHALRSPQSESNLQGSPRHAVVLRMQRPTVKQRT
jgi:hypothetical protein